MSVEEQVREGRPRSTARGDRPRQASRPGLRPVAAAAVVLLLWLVWLALPTGYGEDRAAQARAWQSGQGRDLLSVPAPGARVPDAAVGAVEDVRAAGARPGDAAADDAAADAAGTDDRAADDAAADGAEPGAAGPSTPPSTPAQPAAPVEVPQRGDGTFRVAPGSSEPVGSGSLVRYSVEVEGGLPLEPADVAAVVDGVLADPRSWTGDGSWTLQRTDADPDVRIRVGSPDTTDALCAPLRTGGQLSCRNGADVAVNVLRWTEGADSWGSDLTGYRQYLVNHELGHFLGHGHVSCPGAGQPAPVMLQQTLGLQGCSPNAWPFP